MTLQDNLELKLGVEKMENNVWCTLILGTTGSGRSQYLESLDKNTSFQILPTAQQEEKMFLDEQKRKNLKKSREQKVRDTYWEETLKNPDGIDEFMWISYGLEHLGVKEPTLEQIHQAYNALDWVLVAEGMKRGNLQKLK